MYKINPILYFVLLFLITTELYGQGHEHEEMSYEIRHRGRLYWQMPRRVIQEIGVREGMNVADIGCGDGYFTLVLAEKVGDGGEVYAEDIDAEELQILRERRDQAGVENVAIVKGYPDDPDLPKGIIDVALMVNTLHFIGEPERFFSHVRECLAPEGRLVVVQWAAEKMESEMPGWLAKDREKYTLKTSLDCIDQAGFRVVEQMDFLPMQYIFICRPEQQDEQP